MTQATSTSYYDRNSLIQVWPLEFQFIIVRCHFVISGFEEGVSQRQEGIQLLAEGSGHAVRIEGTWGGGFFEKSRTQLDFFYFNDTGRISVVE